MSYRKVHILIVFIVLSQGACARKRRYYVIQKIINSNSFYSPVPRRLRARKRRYYAIQKILNSNSFYGLVPGIYYHTGAHIASVTRCSYSALGCRRKASMDILSMVEFVEILINSLLCCFFFISSLCMHSTDVGSFPVC
jgi:hypothetical protein